MGSRGLKTRNKLYFSVFLLSGFLLPFTFANPSFASLFWSTQTVDKNSIITDSVFSALDSRGYPHIVYNEYVGPKNNNLMYASWNGSNWELETVAQGFIIQDFAIDPNDKPHILGGWAFNYDQKGMLYASRTGSNWTFQTVDEEGSTDASLDFDSIGNPHIAYVGNNLKYASWTGSKWGIQTLEPSMGLEPVSLALDSNNNPRIMYDTGASKFDTSLRYTVWNNDSQSWNYQTIMANSSVIQLTVDTSDFSHFTCFGSKGLVNTITYGSWNGSGWETRLVISNRNVRTGGYFALDFQNNPHVTYTTNLYSSIMGDLVYFRWNGIGWETQTIDTSATAAKQTAFDSSGNLHVCYLGNIAQSPVGINTAILMYAIATAQVPTFTPSDHSITAENYEMPLAIVAVLAFAVITVLIYLFKKKKQNTYQHAHKRPTDTSFEALVF
jgi:hypothetical protein